ncbi:MAG: Maf family protein [Spirochaetes bacterium]|nr:Maf family protein [Spirochaetota bacterium]
MKVILGSSSPRRKEILEGIIGKFEIRIPHVNEELKKGEAPLQYTERISNEKAGSILSNFKNESSFIIITCDTIVSLNNMIFGKPDGLEDARRIINLLSGKTHEVISSITLAVKNADYVKFKTGTEISRVTFRHLNNYDINNYLSKIDYSDKAGAYAVQEHSSMIIEKIDGSISNVKGFPLWLFYKMMDELNLLEIIFK